MELNGEVWNFGYYNKSDFHCNSQSFRLRHLAPFDWKFLQIGTQRAKDMRKNVFILQKEGSTHFPYTQPDIRVVLLLTEAMRKDFWNPTVCILFLFYGIISEIDLLTWIFLHSVLYTQVDRG